MRVTVFFACFVSVVPADLREASADAPKREWTEKRSKIDTTLEEFAQLKAVGIVYPGSMDYYGTGALISPCHVLTNYHVVFGGDRAATESNKRIEFRFNVDMKGVFQKRVFGKVVGYSPAFSLTKSRHDDWAVMRLDATETVVQPLRMARITYDKARQLELSTFGFPGDMLERETKFYLWGQRCRAQREESDGWMGNCQTAGGSSGSPVTASARVDGRIVRLLVAMTSAAPNWGVQKAGDRTGVNIMTPIISIYPAVHEVMSKNACD